MATSKSKTKTKTKDRKSKATTKSKAKAKAAEKKVVEKAVDPDPEPVEETSSAVWCKTPHPFGCGWRGDRDELVDGKYCPNCGSSRAIVDA